MCALQVIARGLPSNELRGLREMFEALDEDGSGTISVDELREGLRKKGTLLALQVSVVP
jgi:calcium-dependent protein kinase